MGHTPPPDHAPYILYLVSITQPTILVGIRFVDVYLLTEMNGVRVGLSLGYALDGHFIYP